MSICTWGLYELFWFYRNWRLEMARTGEWVPERLTFFQRIDLKDNPFWRSVFSPIYCYSLFERISTFARQKQIPVKYSPLFLTICYLLLAVAPRFLSDHFGWIGLFAFIPLIPAQRLIMTINYKCSPLADPNCKFSFANIILLVIGCILLIFTVAINLLPLLAA